MPLVTYKQMELSGKLGGLVFYTHQGRGIVREHQPARQPDSVDQQFMRAVFKSLSQLYAQALTLQQVRDWERFGARWKVENKKGERYTLDSRRAFQRVNLHRMLAGQQPLLDTPPLIATPAPYAIDALRLNSSSGRLELTLLHAQQSGSGFWRVRMTPPNRTLTSQAKAGHLRSVAINMENSYIPIRRSPQTIRLRRDELRYEQQAGRTCGVEILGLSEDYVPGETLFERRVEVVAG